MVEIKKTLASLTNHYDIYKNTYWGRFGEEVSKSSDFKEIIKNRNDFVDEFGIKKYDAVLRGRILPVMMQHNYNYDHLEAYRTYGCGVVLIMHLYGENEKPIHYLFGKYKKMYTDNSTTYICNFSHSAHVHKFLRQS